MKNLLLDLWHDLREKRLWPVAAVLLVGVVAVPAVMLKPAASAPVPPSERAGADPASARSPQLKDLTVVSDTAASRGGSTLDAFESKDPFRPPAGVLDAQKNKVASVATAAGATAAGSTGSAKGAAGTGDSGGSGGSAKGGPVPTSPGPVTPAPPATHRSYTFVADVDFGRSGHEHRYSTLGKLGMLPSEELPLLIFLGVDSGADDAVFLVDSTLKAAGEGHCSPSPSQCATLAIGAGSEHEFVDEDGRSYTLRVNEIRQERVSKASASSRRAKRRPRAGIAKRRRFVPPVLADLVTVASPVRAHSSTHGRGR